MSIDTAIIVIRIFVLTILGIVIYAWLPLTILCIRTMIGGPKSLLGCLAHAACCVTFLLSNNKAISK